MEGRAVSERLERSTTNRQWAGVCGGLADYFQIDPTLVRAFFVLATIFTGGVFLLVYLVLIFAMPLPSRGVTPAADATASSGEAAPPYAAPATADDAQRAERRREAAGWLLIALGAVFLLANVGILRGVQWNYIWPLALIALGVYIVLQRSRP